MAHSLSHAPAHPRPISALRRRSWSRRRSRRPIRRRVLRKAQATMRGCAASARPPPPPPPCRRAARAHRRRAPTPHSLLPLRCGPFPGRGGGEAAAANTAQPAHAAEALVAAARAHQQAGGGEAHQTGRPRDPPRRGQVARPVRGPRAGGAGGAGCAEPPQPIRAPRMTAALWRWWRVLSRVAAGRDFLDGVGVQPGRPGSAVGALGAGGLQQHGVAVATQVELLINEATSLENLCQCYIGWCPFW